MASARVDILATNGSFYEAHNVYANKIKLNPANEGGFAEINIKSRCLKSQTCGDSSKGEYCPTSGKQNPDRFQDNTAHPYSTCDENDSISKVAKILEQRGITGMPVVPVRRKMARSSASDNDSGP